MKTRLILRLKLDAQTRSIYFLNNVLHDHTSCWMFYVVRTCFDTPVPMHYFFVSSECILTHRTNYHIHTIKKCIVLHVVLKSIFNVKWCDYSGLNNNLLWKFWHKTCQLLLNYSHHSSYFKAGLKKFPRYMSNLGF